VADYTSHSSSADCAPPSNCVGHSICAVRAPTGARAADTGVALIKEGSGGSTAGIQGQSFPAEAEIGWGQFRQEDGRVEMWRGGVGAAYLLPALSSAGASLASPCSVTTSRSSNRTGGSPASGSRRSHAFAHGKLAVRTARRANPRAPWRVVSGYRLDAAPRSLCLAHSH
jgi:hypothetical protein